MPSYSFLGQPQKFYDYPHRNVQVLIEPFEIAPFIPGDVDRDCVVDASDVSATVAAFGSVPGSPNWNQYADFDDNNAVDVFDVISAVNNFGKKC